MPVGLQPDDVFGYPRKRLASPQGSREARGYCSGACVGEVRLVLDGQQLDTGSIESMAFSPDDRRFAYIKETQLAYLKVQQNGRDPLHFAFIDGKEIERYPWVPWGMDYWTWSPPWHPGSSHMPEEFREARDAMAREALEPPRRR
ncbi:hypothetical protein [Hyalangium gracile]|uniref:hypothetical protein n=1 Tax=Hyalangium gracile TaxID=394092 RepID=UPI001CCC798B|nr:hypothetical protein [Hyalangium gracile]